MKNDSRIFLLETCKGADTKTFYVNLCNLLPPRCLESPDLPVVFSCSFQRISLFLIVSPIYSLPHEKLPS